MGPRFMMPDASTIWEYLLRKGIKTYEFNLINLKQGQKWIFIQNKNRNYNKLQILKSLKISQTSLNPEI